VVLGGAVLQCRPVLKQLERLYMLPESLFQWEYSGPRILCIPGSKTPGVELESSLVLSATDSRLGANLNVLVLAAASNRSATRPPLPPPGCGGE